jgi:hypothetical protein
MRKRNVLIILSDHGWGWFGEWLNEHLNTPNEQEAQSNGRISNHHGANDRVLSPIG